MTKLIPLTKGKFAIVDDDDFLWLSRWKKWQAGTRHGGEFCAYRTERRNGKQQNLYMHRLIMGEPVGRQVDHINRNPLDNRKCNLRICTHAENTWNRGKNRSQKWAYKGIYFDDRKNKRKKWNARIQGKYIGSFLSPEEAARAYNLEAQRLFGDFASLNPI